MSQRDPFYLIIKYPVITEKSVLQLEKQGKITLIVEKTATKQDIKRVIEEKFDVKVKKVNTLITPKGEKKAIVTLANKDDAIKIATSLGIL